ncbi:MAG: type II secretion system protein [Saccharofermentans sp.]|nr:type II secretion system protein [Saccharofermentans sp.]
MKKLGKSTKKGFTLVELIVVLVILAILAAMLVPALTGYIKRAREEKDYLMAATVLTAAQSAATYKYSKLSTSAGTTPINWSTSAGNGTTVATLVGDASGKVTACSFTMNNKTGLFTGTGTVTIDGHTYEWTAATGKWEVK